jgi:hypothetical protein
MFEISSDRQFLTYWEIGLDSEESLLEAMERMGALHRDEIGTFNTRVCKSLLWNFNWLLIEQFLLVSSSMIIAPNIKLVTTKW